MCMLAPLSQVGVWHGLSHVVCHGHHAEDAYAVLHKLADMTAMNEASRYDRTAPVQNMPSSVHAARAAHAAQSYYLATCLAALADQRSRLLALQEAGVPPGPNQRCHQTLRPCLPPDGRALSATRREGLVCHQTGGPRGHFLPPWPAQPVLQTRTVEAMLTRHTGHSVNSAGLPSAPAWHLAAHAPQRHMCPQGMTRCVCS